MNDLQGIADSCASDSNGTPAAASSALSGHSVKVTKEAKELEEVEASRQVYTSHSMHHCCSITGTCCSPHGQRS
ncbi:hypothetical protein N7453_002674 [Penicillium expansum]|nr:hypothetical protein N7453_002674 [Penicillium expansum]